jgi:hypothetical protein
MWTERLIETAAMMMIGDGLLAMVEPRRHCLLWKAGPAWWERTLDPFVDHPNMTRVVGAAGLALGVWLARRAESRQLSEA